MISRTHSLLNRALQVAVLAYQALAVGVFIAALVLASSWLKTPFLGAFYEHTMVFNDVRPSDATVGSWGLYYKVDRLHDQLVAVNGVPVRSTADVQRVLSGQVQGIVPTSQGFVAGETIPVTVRTSQGEDKAIEVTLSTFPFADLSANLLIPCVLGLVFLLISLWIFANRRTEIPGRAFSLFASSLAIVTSGLFDLYTTHALTYIWIFACAVGGASLIELALSFPQALRSVVDRPFLRWSGMLPAVLLSLYAFTTLFNFAHPTAYLSAFSLVYLFLAVSALFYLAMNVFYGMTARSPVVKAQARMVLGGGVLSFAPLVVWLAGAPFDLVNFSPFFFLPLVIFPATIGYTILRFRFIRADDWIRRGTVYLILTAIILVSYGLVVAGMGLIFTTAVPPNNIWVGLFLFVLALVLEPLRTRLQEFMDNVFFRGQRAYAERIQSFSHQLTTALDLNTISRMLREQIASTLSPEQVHIFIYDSVNDQYAALPGPDGRLTSEIRFWSNAPLARYFSAESLPLYLDGNVLPTALEMERARLALLGAPLYVALPGDEAATGWLALGPRRSGQPYTPRDLTFLDNLADQASIAIKRVQTVADLERRVQEMNALARVSQGVNVTLTFDDVLELIYAQTSQIIPTTHFHITLHNKDNDYYYYGFCLENGDRLINHENVPFPSNNDLAPEVIRRGRPILTQEYARECHTRGLSVAYEGVYAWMGVPLNAGAETIGALSVATRDASTIYTRSQLDLLQSIADQTAGAIVKARLLQETQQRAHQLSSLNEITRKLTGTLELEPLLQNILDSAIAILNCEAGSLFLVDEQTDELVFKVTYGPVAANLVGQRLPAGSGIVGRAVQMRTPLIENEAQRSPKHFAAIDEQTGFVSRSLLAVPLQIKDRVLGVVEVINRRDGLPFVDEDKDLLTAFASQAAVAMENARLYMLTDQELAARVEELSVMQRIDRELNASLEMERAMRITLDWAMRQSRAEAGLIGVLEDGSLRIMAEQGYEDRHEKPLDQVVHMELPVIKAALESAQPQRVALAAGAGKGGLLAAAHTQLAIPIRREAEVIGLLFLESTSDSQEDIAFLSRLSDHAAIAISNAQLYSEVQRANLAKSEFVSFVAHELKNPMTSIKGYTELLAGGAVGQVNEMQGNFLHTIRSNVERMSTLVSDLNDNSKIEAGRLRLDYKAMDIGELVDEVSRSTRRQLEDKKQTFVVELPEGLPPVWADRTRVAQVLVNLVSNANKYTPEGGTVTLGADAAPNQWDPAGASRVVHMWVRDTGIGISAEDQARIFQKFFRSEDSKAREAPGTGLGLNITRSLVEMQGGRIWFESEFRKGTTFHFTIPVAEG
jgi:signal transduction histidine kinase/putative methionine-R-sulfoxide reductase with GAF domain